MWTFISPVNLIRYLVVWRVQSSLVIPPRPFAKALSSTLGTFIAERLPTPEARLWRRALAAADRTTASPPRLLSPAREPGWPIASVIFPYPGKSAYGSGELILWELKLLGPDADHRLFLEVILPAMEAAATTTDPRWRQPRSLWGHFDIQAIYVARGPCWEPLAMDGHLNLDYHPTPAQWAEGLPLAEGKVTEAGAEEANSTATPTEDRAAMPPAETEVSGPELSPLSSAPGASGKPASRRGWPKRPLRQLIWITPLDLGYSSTVAQPSPGTPCEAQAQAEIPSMRQIITALMTRMTLFVPARHGGVEQVWALLSQAERAALEEDVDMTRLGPARRQRLEAASKDWPGCRVGSQVFEGISWRLLPYLELASILHIGRLTHFGCGTFVLH